MEKVGYVNRLGKSKNIFIKPGYVDFRKQINGLANIAATQMKKDIFSAPIFIFVSKNKSRLKNVILE